MPVSSRVSLCRTASSEVARHSALHVPQVFHRRELVSVPATLDSPSSFSATARRGASRRPEACRIRQVEERRDLVLLTRRPSPVMTSPYGRMSHLQGEPRLGPGGPCIQRTVFASRTSIPRSRARFSRRWADRGGDVPESSRGESSRQRLQHRHDERPGAADLGRAQDLADSRPAVMQGVAQRLQVRRPCRPSGGSGSSPRRCGPGS